MFRKVTQFFLAFAVWDNPPANAQQTIQAQVAAKTNQVQAQKTSLLPTNASAKAIPKTEKSSKKKPFEETATKTFSPQMRAFLDTIACWESGPDGYRSQFGKKDGLDDFKDHPHKVGQKKFRDGKIYYSDAAGRYQFLAEQWKKAATRLGLKDFSPESQDAAAAQTVRDVGADKNLAKGDFQGAAGKVRHVWASLPGSEIGQPTNSMEQAEAFYNGRLAMYKKEEQKREQLAKLAKQKAPSAELPSQNHDNRRQYGPGVRDKIMDAQAGKSCAGCHTSAPQISGQRPGL